MSFRKQTLVGFIALSLFFSCKGDPRVSRDEFFQRAQDYSVGERYREAVIEYRNALQLDEKYLPAHLGLAKAFQKLNEHSDAVQEFRTVLELDGTHAEAKLELGKYYLQGGAENPDNYTEARRLAEELLESNPDNLEARILLGNAHAGLRDLERSVEEMKSVLEQDPQNLTAKMNLGTFQWALSDPVQAEKTFVEALAVHPNSTPVHRALGNLYSCTKDLQKAEHHFRRAFELEPNEEINLYSLVRFFLLTQQAGGVEGVFEEAIQANPESQGPKRGLANFYIARADVAKGVEILQSMLRADPEDRITKIRLAEVYVSQGEAGKAGELVDSLLQADRRDAEAHYLKGRLLLSAGQTDAALEELNRAIQLKNWLLPAYLEKASAHLSRQEYAQAQDALNEILRYDRDNLAANAGIAKIMAMTRKPQNALQKADAVLAVQPENIDALTARGEAYLMLRRLPEAESDFSKLHELDRDNPFYLHRLGSVKALGNQDTEALRFFREALKINADLTDVMNDIIFLHMKNRRFESALLEIDEFMKRTSKQDVGHVFRGRVFLVQEKYREAVSELRKAIELNQSNYPAFMLLGDIHRRQGNLDQAIREIDRLLEQDNQYPPAHLLKAYFLDLKKDLSGAIQYYKSTLRLEPENAMAANNLAWIYCQNNQNLEEALSLARTARQREPNNPEYADTLGWIYYKMSNYALAVDQLLFSVNNGPAQAEKYYRLGMAYYRKGDQNLAKQTLRRSIEIDSSFPQAEEARTILNELG